MPSAGRSACENLGAATCYPPAEAGHLAVTPSLSFRHAISRAATEVTTAALPGTTTKMEAA
jgi:hypothetical protein